MQKRIELPFPLAANLSVTQLYGSSPSHKTGNAIDLAPLISGVDLPTSIAYYLQTYTQLFARIKSGYIRINRSKSCWHYHYYAGAKLYGFGYEQYRGDGKGNCIQFGPSKEFDARAPGASAKFSLMMKQIEMYLTPPVIETPLSAMINAAGSAVQNMQLPQQSPAYVYYDPNFTSEADVLRMLGNFSTEIVFNPSSIWTPISPQDAENATQGLKEMLLWGLAGLAGLLILTRK